MGGERRMDGPSKASVEAMKSLRVKCELYEIQRPRVRDTMDCIFCPVPPNSFRLQGCSYSFYNLELAKIQAVLQDPGKKARVRDDKEQRGTRHQHLDGRAAFWSAPLSESSGKTSQ